MDFRGKLAVVTGARTGMGRDAHMLDQLVRASPETAYEPEFMATLRQERLFEFGGR